MRTDKQRQVDKLNHRLRAIEKKFGKTGALYEGIIKDLKNIEGLKLTKGENISLSTSNQMALDAAEANIATISQYKQEAYEEDYEGNKNLRVLSNQEVKDMVNTYYGKLNDFHESMEKLYSLNIDRDGLRKIHVNYDELLKSIHNFYNEDKGKLSEAHRINIMDKIEDFRKANKV